MVNKVATILIVDDDEDHLSLVERFVVTYGARCLAVTNAAKAIKALKTSDISVLVTDMVMPGLNGLELLTYTKKQYPHIDVVIMTGFSEDYSYVDVINAGATDFIAKPFMKDEFSAKLDRLFRERVLVKKLKEAKEKAEAASKAKSAFLCTISHELITPMNGLLGFVGILKESDLPEEEMEFVKMISTSSDRLMRLINQILDFSNLKTSDKFLPSHCLAATFCDELLKTHRAAAEEKGLKLTCDTATKLDDLLLFTDREIIMQFLNILLENALKFTDSGFVKISIRLAEILSENMAAIEFAIKDSGCGVPPEKQKEIFAPFTQVDDYMTRRHEGAGLGLATCAKLVSLLNGKLWMRNNRGQGATFYALINMATA